LREPTGALINLGELSKPATVLVERVSDAVGGLFKPYQIKRLARAEADAALIRASGEIEVTDLQRRALQRVLHEEAQRQQNIEQITRLALPDVASDASPGQIDPDWLTHFFDRGRLVSDAEMQTLWGRLLAGEANKPGAFGRRTIDMVSTFDKEDARLFTTLCTFGWVIGNVVPLVFDVQAEVYNKVGVNFNSLTHLDSIGLVRFENLTGFVRQRLPKDLDVSYYGRRAHLEFQAVENNLNIGTVLLTVAGQQLTPISGSRPVDGFYDYVCGFWESNGHKLTKTSA
jgi:uncharacterized protein DUF2806